MTNSAHAAEVNTISDPWAISRSQSAAIYDHAVHEYLNLAREQGQVVYHFAVGYAVHDTHSEG